MRLFLGDGAVFDATGHDQELARVQPDVPVPKLHPKVAPDDEEQFVLVVVVPDERTQELGELDLLPVQLADDPRTPEVAEHRQLLSKVHLLHDKHPLLGPSFSDNRSWRSQR
jgi:hypothetical protein